MSRFRRLFPDAEEHPQNPTLWQYMPGGAGVTAAAHKERAEAMLPPSLSVLYLCCQSRRSFSSSYSRT